MPASIHHTSEVSKLFNAAPFSFPSPSSSTITCDSIKTIEAWLDKVEEPKVTVIVKELSKASQGLAQELEAKNTRKRKYSSSLTEDNLSQSSLQKRSQHLLQFVTDYGMAGNTLGAGQIPLTPKGSSTSIPSTPSASAYKTKSKAPVDPSWLAGCLEEHGLKCDHKALGRYPEFEKMILDIVSSDRHSKMKLKSVKRVQKKSLVLEEENEGTFLNSLLPLIVKEDRTVELEKDGSTSHSLETSGDGDMVEVLNPQRGVVYGSRDWFDDGVHVVTDHDFRQDLLPHRYVDELVARMLKKDDNMLTPRPDRCYGLLRNWIPFPEGIQLNPEIRTLIEACPGLSHSFFLIEGKSNRGSKFDAMLQARRGGASLVNAMRQLLAKIGEPHVTESGVDDRNFVFSATMSRGLMDFWVHWAELRAGIVVFHMNRIGSKALNDPESIPQVRKILNNIMTWGLDLKTRRLPDLHEKIATWQMKETARFHEEAHQKEAERKAKSEQSKKRQRTG